LEKRKRNRKFSIMMVEQNAKKAMELTDRTYVLEDGLVGR
jgi:ABC-type branched-subunit amino acid transport system ATPase component